MFLKDHIDIDRYLLDWWRRKVVTVNIQKMTARGIQNI